jgi:hypothetical protein
MKRIKLIIIAMFLVTLASAQSDTSKWGKYAGVSLSFSNGDDLKTTTYFTVEGGYTYSNLSFGLGVGRGNFAPGEERDSWFVEPKASFTLLEAGIVKGYLTTGLGGYFFKPVPHYFVEYGGGVTVSTKHYDLGFQMSNWDGINYVSTGIYKNF